MNTETQKQIALNLIANDLINCKLIYGLKALHIDAGMYSLCIAESIFKLMGFSETQCTPKRYDQYAALCRKALDMPYAEGEENAIKALAEEIYEALMVVQDPSKE